MIYICDAIRTPRFFAGYEVREVRIPGLARSLEQSSSSTISNFRRRGPVVLTLCGT